MADNAAFDLGPLSWVKGEIDVALERAGEALRQFGANPVDVTQARLCRNHLHQVRGALTIVGLDGVTQFTDALEGLLGDLESGHQSADAPRLTLVSRALQSVRHYLDSLIAGEPNQPLRLFDLYRQIAAARGQAAPSASDLFFPDLGLRPNLPPAVPPASPEEAAAKLKLARSRFQKGMLGWLKNVADASSANECRAAAAAVGTCNPAPVLRAFWWAVGGLFSALAHRAVPLAEEIKPLLARIDQQIRQQIDGSRTVPERLMRDVLFYVAIARTPLPEIAAIRAAYQLDALIPTDNKPTSQTAQIEPLIRRLRELTRTAEDGWNRFCGGQAAAIGGVRDASAALAKGAEQVGLTDFKRLTQALATITQWVAENPSRRSEAVAMETATAILLLGNSLDNFAHLGTDFVHQVDVMVARLHACIGGKPLSDDVAVPMLDEMTRQAQEKLLIGQVVREIQSNLGQIEQALDTYFRDATQQDQLKTCQRPFAQIVGALTVLGQDQAVAALLSSSEVIAKFTSPSYRPQPGDFERVANQLSELGFFVEALRSGTPDYASFVTRLGQRSEAPKPASGEAFAASEEEAMASAQLPAAAPAGAPEAAQPAPPAAAPVVAAAGAAPAEPAAESAATKPSPPAVKLPEDSEIDAELLEIFLEEANEVLATIAGNLDVLKAQPSDVEALTTMRRAFHTLKGSSRMVGLKDFGEIAWVVEQVNNLWLRQERPADMDFFRLIQDAHTVFAVWVEHLASGAVDLPDTSELVARCNTLKGLEVVTLTPPQPERPAAPAETPLQPPADRSASFADELTLTLGEAPAFAAAAELELEPQAELPRTAVAALEGATGAGEEPELALELAGATPTRDDAAPSAAAEEARDDSVPVLFQIFLDEAQLHIGVLRRCFSQIELDPTLPSPAEMVRAAHTLGSIGGTVGFAAVLKLGHGLETALIRRNHAAQRANLEALEIISQVVSALENDVLQIAAGKTPEENHRLVDALQGAYADALESEHPEADLIAATSVILPEDLAALDEVEPDEFDESLLPVFIEEASDLIEGINERLAMWSANPGDANTIHALARLLHTLKGSARMAGAMSIGALAHAVEAAVDVAHHRGYAGRAEIARVQSDFDTIAERIVVLRGRPAPEAMPRLDETPAGEPAFISPATIFTPSADSAAVDIPLAPPASVAEAEADSAAIEFPELAVELEPLPAPEPITFPELVVELAPVASSVPAVEAIPVDFPELVIELDPLASVAPVGEAAVPPRKIAPPEPVSAQAPPVAARRPFAPEPVLAKPLADQLPPLPRDSLDEDLLPIFLEEANELVKSIYAQLDAWRHAPADHAAQHALARALHTLKGSARMAGAMSIGALTHTLEARVEELGGSGRVPVDAIVDVQNGFDAIASVIERLQQGEALAEITVEAPGEERTSAPATAFSDEPAIELAAVPAIPITEGMPEAPVSPSPATAIGAKPQGEQVARPMLRVRADLIDRLVNDAGELSIARARIEGEMRGLKQAMLDLTENIIRLRRQLREIEIQAESQLQSRIALSSEAQSTFDPLELDRFTRFQELTRMMAESVNDVATVQQTLLKSIDESNAALANQGRLNRELQQALMSVRMVPFSSIVERLYRITRQTAKETGKRADLDVVGSQIELDQNIINKMIGPLEHLLRNAVSHGIERPDTRRAAGKEDIGEIKLALRQEGNEVIITMRDDGAGLDLERIRAKAVERGLLGASEAADARRLTDFIFHSGFSTATQVSQVSGRGVGMDVVRSDVGDLGGRIEVQSDTSRGTTFRIYLPLTLAVTNAALIRVGLRSFAIPSSMIDQVMEIKQAPLVAMRDAGKAVWQGNEYPFHFLPHLLGDTGALPEARRFYWVILLHSGAQRAAIQVDELQGSQEVVVKNIGPQLARVVGIAGATVLGDGRVLLILNPVALAARPPVIGPTVALPAAARAAEEAAAMAHLPTVLVVDDSLTVRKVTSRLLSREGYQVITAKDGVDALQQMIEFVPDVILSDIEMPRMDGFELARNIRADERLRAVPIVMITSRTADKHRSHAVDLGVDHYLGKPYQEDELLRLIAGYTASKRLTA